VISDRDASRLLKRAIAEIVYDGTAIVGVIRMSQRQETVIEAPSMPHPKKFHRRQDLGGCWCWQLLDAQGKAVA
jgi:hypothetical protein